MGIRFMDEVAKDIIMKGEISLPQNCITGSSFEKWLYETDNDNNNSYYTMKLMDQKGINFYDPRETLGDAA